MGQSRWQITSRAMTPNLTNLRWVCMRSSARLAVMILVSFRVWILKDRYWKLRQLQLHEKKKTGLMAFSFSLVLMTSQFCEMFRFYFFWFFFLIFYWPSCKWWIDPESNYMLENRSLVLSYMHVRGFYTPLRSLTLIDHIKHNFILRNICPQNLDTIASLPSGR